MAEQNGPIAAWLGRTETATDMLTDGVIAGLRATLDYAEPATPGSPAPQGAHWLLAPPRVAASVLGEDGHPAKGGFLPPVDLPRRMWAGSKVQFLAPLPIGAVVQRSSEIASIESKSGTTGSLVFVEVQHETSAAGVVAVSERQTIVYREANAAATAKPAPPPKPEPEKKWDWRRELTPDAVMLFRYSALTFNGHRIHYDFPYATQVEGYAGLVVHGPLLATLLLDLCARELGPNKLRAFSFRGKSPVTAGRPLTLVGRVEGERIELAALVDNRIATEADARI